MTPHLLNHNHKLSLDTLKQRVEYHLDERLAQDNCPTRLLEAMRYTVLSGGKRIRPLLVYTTGLSLGLPIASLDASATAVELIHAYSLIHDDLPAMDDDDIRRGEPTCHKAYDEATAILAGDALQTLAFQTLSAENAHLSHYQQLRIIGLLAEYSGHRGMAGGQMLDMQLTNKTADTEQIEQIHCLKTGALIEFCMLAPAISANCCHSDYQRIKIMAKKLGLAFQIQDDVLEIESNTTILGKSNKSDLANSKATYSNTHSTQQAKNKVTQLFNEIFETLNSINCSPALLNELLISLLKRKN